MKTALAPIFRSYPALGVQLPHCPLGEFPTPIERCNRLAHEVNAGGLYIKHDSLSGVMYGGNKVRKLEFLLGDALRSGAKEVMTFGAAGSNHALATALYARKSGLRSISMLAPQPVSVNVRRNLLMSLVAGAELHLYKDFGAFGQASRYQCAAHKKKYGVEPYVIPAGGSAPRGVVGFVNAAFELKEQIDAGVLPEPDFIYVAMGTMGTVAGLMLGIKALGLKTQVVPVRVVAGSFANAERCSALIAKTNALLHDGDQRFPEVAMCPEDIRVNDDFFDPGYGLCTDAVTDAIATAQRSCGIKLEGTYTGKAFAALLHDAAQGGLAGKTVLFWNTCSGRDFSDLIAGVDYRKLPARFHHYFTDAGLPLEHTA
jgi:1-aminocyclopropane-1-carboxylate deaminase/D-cysteine desulfhydrase-like pyridoxal-dependent ACC family enzyme